MKKYIFFFGFFLISSIILKGQPTTPDRMLQLEANLTAFAKKNKQLKDKAELDINTNIKDLAAALAENHNLNIVVDADVDFPARAYMLHD